MKRADGNAFATARRRAMYGAAGAPPQLTDGACVAAQSTDVAALRHTLQARPLALRLHRERAIGAKSTDLCAVDFHVGRAQRADNRGSRMLSRTRAHRASGGPGGGRPSSPPERPWPGSGIKGGCFSARACYSSAQVWRRVTRYTHGTHESSRGDTHDDTNTCMIQTTMIRIG